MAKNVIKMKLSVDINKCNIIIFAKFKDLFFLVMVVVFKTYMQRMTLEKFENFKTL